MSITSRAAPLPPAERRAAIVAAALPLVCDRGTAVTTREIAEAAGIAEGTIFRVFPDKDALMTAVVGRAFDPAPCVAELRAIDATLPLEGVVEQAIEALRRRLDTVWHLVGLLRAFHAGAPGPLPAHRPDITEIIDTLGDLMIAHRDHLRWPPGKAARLLHLVTVAATHPILTDHQPFETADILDLLVHGFGADETREPADDLAPADRRGA